VVVWDETKQEWMMLLTNHLEFGATTISAIYKDRWQIELFFQGPQAKPEGQDLCGDERQCLTDSDWDSLNGDAAVEIPTTEIATGLGPVKSGSPLALELVYLSRPVGLDRRPV
jgi:hypothetical protein